MRIAGMIVMVMFGIGGQAFAATVNLTDGRVVQGDIIKQDPKSLQMSVEGITMTYYADEIKDIDGKPFVPGPSGPVAVPQALPAADGIDQDKKTLILKFIDVFGTRKALTNNLDSVLKQIEKENPEEAQKFRQRLNVDEIIDRLLPIYDHNFTTYDLRALIAFYGSPEGQKLLDTLPILMKESVGVSVKYMKEKFPEAGPRQ